jgi:protein-disulfide isomerase
MDENNPDMSSAKPRTKARSSRKAKKAVKMRAPNVSQEFRVPVALYIVLGIIVLATTFVAGYFAGKNDVFTGGPGTTAGGKIQIIEYSDFQCPFCSRALPTIAQIKSNYGSQVEIIYKHFPLESIHPDALNAAIASECVRAQGGDVAFWKYHDTLFANQGALGVASLKSYAQAQGGIDTAKFNTCLDGKQTESKIRADMQEAQERGVTGTPSFWVKDEIIIGAQPYDVFKTKIDQKLSGKAAVPAPTAPAAPSAPTPPAVVDMDLGKNVKGSADATVEIVEFTDYQCPFCKRFFDETEHQIIKEYVETGKARLAVRHFPLSFHQNAQKAAEAAECAAKQGKFWEMHEMLFEKSQPDGTGLNVADLKSYAAKLGLDTAVFNTCLDNGETAQIVQGDFAAGQAAGTSGTPSFYINGKQIVGAQPFASFKAAIDAELS